MTETNSGAVSSSGTFDPQLLPDSQSQSSRPVGMSFVREASINDVDPNNLINPTRVMRVGATGNIGPYSLSHASDKEGTSTRHSSMNQQRNNHAVVLSDGQSPSIGTDP